MKSQWQRIAKHLPDIRIGDPVLVKGAADKLDEYLSRIEALEAENARLREALEWYAGLAEMIARVTIESEFARQELKRDMGGRARAALKQEGGE